jgi:BirA family transcriptional regulator, biotin operon repressor / biotin---[acetyl-CoA-carboxylase] ligase
MNHATLHQPFLSTPSETPRRISHVGRWTVQEHEVVPSTNLLAAHLPAWHAIRADHQSAGRGRFQRTWVSDRGGLWLSAVLPTVNTRSLKLLPLAAGLALCDALRSFGVDQLRMRWPNDILVGNRKLAGLLIDQFVPGLAVVGLGINVSNRPEQYDSALRDQVARLEELTSPTPALGELMSRVLAALEEVNGVLEGLGPETLLPRINALWPALQPVELDLDGQVITGDFEGVDSAGRLKLRSPALETIFYEPHQVRLLREILNP